IDEGFGREFTAQVHHAIRCVDIHTAYGPQSEDFATQLLCERRVVRPLTQHRVQTTTNNASGVVASMTHTTEGRAFRAAAHPPAAPSGSFYLPQIPETVPVRTPCQAFGARCLRATRSYTPCWHAGLTCRGSRSSAERRGAVGRPDRFA